MQHRGHSVLFAMLVLMAITACRSEKHPEEILRPVRYQAVYSTGGERMRSFSGVAQAGLESRLSFKVSGTLQNIAVKVGDQVSRGDLIAQLSPSDYELQVQQAQASLESARAQVRNAESNYERIRQLYENRNASRNDLDAARAAFESASAQVEALSKQLELANSQLTYTRLRAPVSGAIAAVDVEVGENVQPGQSIVQLSSGANMEVKVTIPEILISQVREGQIVTVSFDALPEQQFAGIVTEVGVASMGFATTYPVTVRIQEESDNLRPGMAAEVAFNFATGERRERIIVPSVAVGEDRNGRFVFTVESAGEPGVGIVRRNAVVIGELTDNGIEILEGLIDGSRVVTAGVSKLTDGQRVKFLQPGQN